MRQRAKQRKNISMILLVILCLMGIYGTMTMDVPVYTSFSCVENGYQSDALVQDPITIAVERFYQDSLVKVPDAEQATERMEQTQAVSLLERCRPERRSSRATAERPESETEGIIRQITGISRCVDGTETASFFNQIRIISYIHAQDGQKDHTV